jgi:hypothetical protein
MPKRQKTVAAVCLLASLTFSYATAKEIQGQSFIVTAWEMACSAREETSLDR